MDMVQGLIEKVAGGDTARRLVDDIALGYAANVKAAAEAAEAEEAKVAYINDLIAQYNALVADATPEDLERMEKVAAVLLPALERYKHPAEKLAAIAGAMDQAAMEDAGAFGEGPEAEAAGLPGGGEGESLTLEDIAGLLQAMIQNGEIDEQTALGILEQLAAGGEGGEGGAPAGPEAGLPPEAAAAAGAPAGPEGALPPEVAAAEVPLPEEGATEPEKAAAAFIANLK